MTVLRGVTTALALAVGFLSAQPGTAQAAAVEKVAMTTQAPPAPVQHGAFAFPAVFGKNSVAPGGPQPFKQWATIMDRFRAEISDAGYCQASLFSRCHFQEWQGELDRLSGRDLMTQLDRVNRFMNQIRYVPDIRNYRQTDYWAAPLEFLKNGGDCEDYAIAKYMSLRALGVPDERMRIVVLMDTAKRQGHAVLVVATNSGLMLLDNLRAEVTPVERIAHYMPVFSMNQGGWWVHR
jgi:predicted transglutaminase-like cysteine proteinase